MQLTVRRETFPIRGTFRIARGAKTEAELVVVELRSADRVGRGECVPYRRYGETVESVLAEIQALAGEIADEIAGGLDRAGLATRLPAGAARNALDCAFWDLEAKQAGRPAWQLAGLAEPRPVATAFTISLDAVEKMEAAAGAAASLPLLKLKLTGEGDLDRVRAVRRAAPSSRLIVDANEAWTFDQLVEFAPEMASLGVELIEQPLPAGADAALEGFRSPVPLGADESCHDTNSLPALVGRYQVVNLKLDKTGGLTEALRFRAFAREAGLGLMIGCMVGTSLAMAPALLLAGDAAFVDLDGPLLLAHDRTPGLRYDGAIVEPPSAALWG